MARRGRPRKPTAQLKLAGSYREDRRPKGEPTPEPTIPKKPTFLKGEAAKEWKRLAPLLAQQKCLTEWDRSMLAAYCAEWGLYVESFKYMDRVEKIIKTTSKGNTIQHPFFQARNKLLQHAKELATEFGMTPSSRSRINTSDKNQQEESPFIQMLKERRKA